MTGKFLETERKISEPLAAWIARHRRDGMSGEWMAIELSRLSGVDVAPAEVQQWADETACSVTYQADPFDLCQ